MVSIERRVACAKMGSEKVEKKEVEDAYDVVEVLQ